MDLGAGLFLGWGALELVVNVRSGGCEAEARGALSWRRVGAWVGVERGGLAAGLGPRWRLAWTRVGARRRRPAWGLVLILSNRIFDFFLKLLISY